MIIPHLTLDPDYTFGVSIAVITIILAGYGVYKGFFANDGLTDPWDDQMTNLIEKMILDIFHKQVINSMTASLQNSF